MVTFRPSVRPKLCEGGLGTGDHVPPAQILGPHEGEELACFWMVCDLWLGFRNDSLLCLGRILDCGCWGQLCQHTECITEFYRCSNWSFNTVTIRTQTVWLTIVEQCEEYTTEKEWPWDRPYPQRFSSRRNSTSVWLWHRVSRSMAQQDIADLPQI